MCVEKRNQRDQEISSGKHGSSSSSPSESVDSDLDLFTIPPTETSLEHGMYVEIYPLAALRPSNDIGFNINQKK